MKLKEVPSGNWFVVIDLNYKKPLCFKDEKGKTRTFLNKKSPRASFDENTECQVVLLNL